MIDQKKIEEKRQWSELIGNVILTFGDIEYYLALILIHIPDENRHLDLIDKKFKYRANQAIQELRKLTCDAKNQNRIIRILNDCMKLSEKRNLIAHNPLHMSFYDSSEGLDFRHEIVSLRKSDVYMDFEELKKLSRKIEDISSDFYEAYVSLTYTLHEANDG